MVLNSVYKLGHLIFIALWGRYSFVPILTNDENETYRLYATKGQGSDSYILKSALSVLCNASWIITREKKKEIGVVIMEWHNSGFSLSGGKEEEVDGFFHTFWKWKV